MAIFGEQAFVKEFTNEVSKQAYLDACKWLAVNLYNNVELSKHTLINIEKKEEAQLPTFVVTVYARIDEKEQRSIRCKKCKMLHTMFYSVDGINCNKCDSRGYQKQLDEDIVGIRTFVTEVLEKRG